MLETSNFIINAELIAPPEGVIVKNFCFDGEPQFKSKPRKCKLQHFVLHETAGITAKGCKDTLIRKGYGVHLILDRDGTISCHGDLANDVMKHANQLNKTSVGIEVVNPYYPKAARNIKHETIPAQWWTHCSPKSNRRYVLPTKDQLNTLVKVVPFLCKRLNIPYVFPTIGLDARQRKIKGWMVPPRAKPGPGVVAHCDFASHSDGRYLLEYLLASALSN